MKSNYQILEYMGKKPRIDESVFLAPGSQVVGDVVIGKNSSIWFQTLVRGDVNYIRIGENVNIQDLTIVHVARDVYPVEIGNNVSIGHRAT
ncbi:gamma carbonic anhydrase family protein, partial [Leptospira santarosai]|uniref:gamma carbonic anhydrase family protein n=2 Tax=Leptospira TaxID=171 RepID=UPI00403604C7